MTLLHLVAILQMHNFARHGSSQGQQLCNMLMVHFDCESFYLARAGAPLSSHEARGCEADAKQAYGRRKSGSRYGGYVCGRGWAALARHCVSSWGRDASTARLGLYCDEYRDF